MDPETWVPVGEPLSPAEAGFLELELEGHGIEYQTRFCEEGEADRPNRQVVQVAPANLEEALALRAQVLEEPTLQHAPPPKPESPLARWRNASLAAVLGAVAVLRFARILHAGVMRGAAALVVGLLCFVVVLGFKRPPADGEPRAPRKQSQT